MKIYNKGVRFEDSVSDTNGRRFKTGKRDNSLVLPSRGGKQLHLSTINENILSLNNSVNAIPRYLNYGNASNDIDSQYLYGEVAVPNSEAPTRKSIGLNRKSLDSIKLKAIDHHGNVNTISEYPYSSQKYEGTRKLINDKSIDYF